MLLINSEGVNDGKNNEMRSYNSGDEKILRRGN